MVKYPAQPSEDGLHWHSLKLVDVKVYQAHSTRAASASKAATAIPVDVIMKSAGWPNESTFRKFYEKSITVTDELSNAVLN